MNEHDLNVLTSLLKMFLSELETPLVPNGLLNSKKGSSAAKILNSLGGAKQKILENLIVQLELESYNFMKKFKKFKLEI